MTDLYKDSRGTSIEPVSHAVAVAAGVDTVLTFTTRAVYVGGTGDITVLTAGGETVTFVAPLGWNPIRCTKFFAATTATGIVATA